MALDPERFLPVMAVGVTKLLTKHFMDLDKNRPNALGGKRTHFYGRGARSVHWESSGNEAMVSVMGPRGLRAHYLGATITPGKSISWVSGKPTQYLTIPARAESYGMRTQEFSDRRPLTLVWGKKGPFALAEKIQRRVLTKGQRRRKGETGRNYKSGKRTGITGGMILYWLVKKVTLNPDPSVLPTQRSMEEAAVDAGRKYLAIVARRAGYASIGALGQDMLREGIAV